MVALLAETWLVMNNPICLSLLLELLVLHAHTHSRICHRSFLNSLRGSRERVKDKEGEERAEILGVSWALDKHREVVLWK